MWNKIVAFAAIVAAVIKIKLGGGDSVDIKSLLKVVLPTILGFLVKFLGDKIGMDAVMQNGLTAALLFVASYFLGSEVKMYSLRKAGKIRD